jgi:hypothetical protein
MFSIRNSCVAALAASAAVFAVTLTSAHAADRQPLVLDTQRGISDGQSGIVMQNAPLSRAPMVNAQSPARPAELAPPTEPPIIVAPYLQVPGASGGSQTPSQPSWPSGSSRPRPRPAVMPQS